MAQRTEVLLIDDLDGSSADETVAFGLDGSAYEIDLSAKNANQLRKSLASYVASSRKAALIRGGARRRGAAATGAIADTADVRSWARSNGYAVNDRGRLSAEVVEAYRAVH
jgi:Lsr2